MTNRERLSKMNLFDLLLLIHNNRVIRNTTCVLEMLDRKYECTTDSGTCAECIQRYLNADSNPPLAIGANTCVCCGAIIPEGWQVCRKCEEEQ